MADALYQRRVELTFNDGATAKKVSDLRVSFKVTKSLRKEPNTAEIQVYNLAPSTRSQMKSRYMPIILAAGYQTTMAQIFSGQARVIDHEEKGADWVTKIQCGDGEQAFRYARMTESHAKGAKVSDIVSRLVNTLGGLAHGSGNIVSLITDQFAQGYSAHGSSADQLDKILRLRGYEWSLQDGQVQILSLGKATKQTAVVLSPTTGMIGSPEHGTPEPTAKRDRSHILKVKSLLQPTLVPGGICQVQANGLPTAQYRIEKVTHDGDTFGGNWQSELEVVPLS